MALVNREEISLYNEARSGLSSLAKQTAQVFIGLLVMLLLTGGTPPGWIVTLSFFVGIGFGAWSENKRLTGFEEVNLSDAPKTLVDSEQQIATSEDSLSRKASQQQDVHLTNTEALLPQDISPNKRAVLERSVALFSPDSQKLQALIQQVVEAKTDNFLALARITGLNPGKDFAGANLIDANLRGADLHGAYLIDAKLSHAILIGAYLIGTKLKGANLSRAILSHANLRSADLHGAYLIDAKLNHAILIGAYLIGAYLIGAYLIGADLSGTDLRGIDLRSANLIDASLIGTNLSHANLSHANLRGADLSGTDLNDTNNVEKARFVDNLGISEGVKHDLLRRGAIFEDSLGDRSEVPTRR